MSLLLPMLTPLAVLLMQVGIDPRGGQVPGVPDELRDRPPRGAAQTPRTPAPAPVPAKLRACLEQARSTPNRAIAEAQAWLATATGAEKAQAGHCLGMAQTETGQWTPAARSFAGARDAAVARDHRARLGLLAAAAALAGGDTAGSLAILDAARGDAAGDMRLRNDIEFERSRALFLLGRIPEARLALEDARAADPSDAEAWLLSATLSRRADDLSAAQSQIAQAAALAPRDVAIGLEAGIIAALRDQDVAARRNFEAVIAIDPDSAEARTARGYLVQLEARSGSAATTRDKDT